MQVTCSSADPFARSCCYRFMCPQLGPTLCDCMDHSPLAPSVHGISQARILEWVAISSSRGSSPLKDWTCISCIPYIGRWILYHWATWEAISTGTYPQISAKQISITECFPGNFMWKTHSEIKDLSLLKSHNSCFLHLFPVQCWGGEEEVVTKVYSMKRKLKRRKERKKFLPWLKQLFSSFWCHEIY